MDKVYQLKNKLKQKGIQGIALDIDETIAATFRNWVEHLLEDHNEEKLTVEEMVKKYRYFRDVPYWQKGPALYKVIEMIGHDKFQEDIPLLEDASLIVNQIHKIIPVVAYITARPRKVQGGTVNWLNKYKFPRGELFFRPDDRTDGHRWKGQVLDILYPQVVGIIDDDPKLVKNMVKDYQGTVFVFNLPEFNTSGYPFKIIPCGKWDHVLETITSIYGPAKTNN